MARGTGPAGPGGPMTDYLMVPDPDADPELLLRGVLFGAVGTAGQRCTSTRRLFLHRDIASDITGRLVSAYGQVAIGDPLDPATLMGPLVDGGAVETYSTALETTLRTSRACLRSFQTHNCSWTTSTGIRTEPRAASSSQCAGRCKAPTKAGARLAVPPDGASP